MTPPTASDQRGQISVFITVLILPLMLTVGLVWDGGGVLAAHQRAVSDAFEAARAGANAIDLDALRRGGDLQVDPGAARQAAAAYLASIGRTGSVAVDGDHVTVTVEDRYQPAVLAAAGVGTIHIHGTATATPNSQTP